MNQLLNEGLRYRDMVNQIVPLVEIDKYQSSVGKDDDVVTINFTVKSKQAANDLSEWFERGYDWVIDSDISPGEVLNGKHLVFVEMHRRTKTPHRVIELLEDLKTLTDLDVDDWKVYVGKTEVEPNEDSIGDVLETSPHEYRKIHDEELNEWREIAGIKTVPTYEQDDPELRALQRIAGIY